jgi:thioredoxin 1
MAGANTLTFDDSNFEQEVLKSDMPVLVDFWAQWCGPCLQLAPTIDELAENFQGKAKVGKVDVDSAAALASQYGIQNIPTVLLFDKGEPVERVVGAKHRRDYEALINARLAGGTPQ